MKHTHKRILSIFAAAALSFCSLPQSTPLLLQPAITASAGDTANPASEFETSQIGDAIQITAWNGSGNSVVIPAEINGLPVNEIRNSAFKGKSLLKEVVIPDSVERIAKNVFNGCAMLSNITLPKRLESIGEGAFYGCLELTEFTVPDGVTKIEYNTFANCGGLKKVTLPDSVTSIGKRAFENTALTDIKLPVGLIELGEYAFHGCKLKKVSIPDGVEDIGDHAFDDCRSLSDVALPKNLKRIGIGAFSFCGNLKSVTVPDGTERIDSYALRNSGLTEIIIPESVTDIAGDAFQGVGNLTIYGTAGSAAETAANIRDYFTFVAFTPPETTSTATTTTTTTTIATTTTTTTVTTSAAATKPVTTTVSYPEAQIYAQIIRANPGEAVIIPVFLLKNPGITALSLNFSYDNTKLELLGVENGLIFSGTDFTPGNDLHAVPYTVTWNSASRSNLTGNGILAYLNVRVPEDAEGNIPIDLTLNQKATFNADSEEVAFDVLYGMVMVQSAATTPKPVTTTAQATTTTAKATTTTAQVTTTTAKATTTTAKATTTTAKATTTTAKATTTTAQATTTTAKAPTTTAQATTTTAKATTTAAPVTTTIPAETTPVVTTTAAPAPLRGDVTGDGIVSVDDAQLTLKAYTERIAGNDMKLTAEQIKAADIDGNGEISVEDAQWILKYYTGKYVAGKDITLDDVFGKQAQSLPRLLRKRNLSL